MFGSKKFEEKCVEKKIEKKKSFKVNKLFLYITLNSFYLFNSLI